MDGAWCCSRRFADCVRRGLTHGPQSLSLRFPATHVRQAPVWMPSRIASCGKARLHRASRRCIVAPRSSHPRSSPQPDQDQGSTHDSTSSTPPTASVSSPPIVPLNSTSAPTTHTKAAESRSSTEPLHTAPAVLATDSQQEAHAGVSVAATTAADAADEQPVSKALAVAFAPGAFFMFLSVLPPTLFILHRLFVVLLQLIVFVIFNIVFADHSVPPLAWRNFCQSCIETSSLLDEMVPVLLLALAGLQQAFMDSCSTLFRILLLAPSLIPAAAALGAWLKAESVQRKLADMGQWLPEAITSRWVAASEQLHGVRATVVAKVPAAWGERVAQAWSLLQSPAAQQALMQASILVMTGWLASVFTEPLRPGSRGGTTSLVLFILLRIATFVVDVAVMKELWRGMRTVMQGAGTLSHWVSANQQVVLLAAVRAGLELSWALLIGLRCMFGITTGWKVLVALYLLYFAFSTWQLSREQAVSWPQCGWSTLCVHAAMAMIVSWPLCLPSWELLPELGIIFKGSHGFWGSL